ncbi:MAG: DUF2808 domain-containing protein [Cyanobacteria bacterium]|nr:DUF2808 domain-containing protein [Cyanobacteriota bacterium]MDA0865345.1 DUF2808 domain-containing protein [Cyanobacteriota bacterium]
MLASGAIAPVTQPALAQRCTTTAGFTLFGGIDSEVRLAYAIDNNERRSTRARYYLKVAAGAVSPREILELEIFYPQGFEDNHGNFDNAEIEVREGTGRGGDVIPTSEIVVDSESNTIQIYFEDAIPESTSFMVVIDKVRNPNRYGIHYFHLDALYQGDSVRTQIGTWPLDVAAGCEN